MIKEHKYIILRYLKYVLDNGYTDSNKYYMCYKRIFYDMDIIFMKIIKKRLQKRKCFIDEIDQIRRLNEREAELLNNYLERKC